MARSLCTPGPGSLPLLPPSLLPFSVSGKGTDFEIRKPENKPYRLGSLGQIQPSPQDQCALGIRATGLLEELNATLTTNGVPGAVPGTCQAYKKGKWLSILFSQNLKFSPSPTSPTKSFVVI